MFFPARIQYLNDGVYTAWSVLYWTEGALRYEWNCGLEYATQTAHDYGENLIALATIDQEYAHDNIRQLVFLVESLVDLRKTYQDHQFALSIRRGDTRWILEQICREQGIGMIVASASYVRYFRDILEDLARSVSIPVVLVDDASLVPPWITSDHAEYAAYTLRKKYWQTVQKIPVEIPEVYEVTSLSVGDDLDQVLSSLWYSQYVEKLSWLNLFPGGASIANVRWCDFLNQHLSDYDELRNNPLRGATSGLSSYFHFGCISPLQIFHDLRDEQERYAGFLEECFVRRELAINMWYYEPHPDTWECLPDWVIKTLDEDRERQAREQMILQFWNIDTAMTPEQYWLEDLVNAKTDDPLWNAAQRELVSTGKIHGYVRMYWGKQLLRWFTDWREAYRVGVYLNDRFAVDGCSPNGYTGIAWCFGKHDRPFPPKKTHYGLVRSMTFGGMKKKFDVTSYIAIW